MKKLFLILSLFILSLSVGAQEIDMMGVVPADAEVRTGTLANGAQYYIRKNSKDPERANFHIIYKVGAVLEEDRQDGLAHFLEHMAFNGSDSFQGNGLIDYCQSIGVEFGNNLNAWTSQEKTSYMISGVPITREGIVDSMLLVLHDWAGYISLNEDDIDDERGVISEEWRMVEAQASTRLRRKATELIYGTENIYNQRDVIGPLENIQGFAYQDIRDFYHKWYRPDLQAFVIVGDFDPEVMEEKLIAVMANVPAAEEKAAWPKIKFSGNEETRFGVFTDPELSRPSVNLICKIKANPTKYNDRYMYEKTEILNYMALQMLNKRLSEISKTPESPFLNASTYFGNMSKGMDIFGLMASSAVGGELAAFEGAYTELLRAVQSGFVLAEFDRIKAEVISHLEQEYNDRDDRSNSEYVEIYSDNFYDNTPFASAEHEYEYSMAIVEAVTLDEINAQMASMLTEENVVVYAEIQNKEGAVIPTVEELEALYAKVNGSTIEPYFEEVITRPLLDAELLKGSKVKKEEAGKFESVVWTLKNGVKIVVKPTDFAADEISFSAVRQGGTSTITDLEKLYSIGLMGMFDGLAGLSDFSSTELSRALTGTKFSIAPFVGSTTEGFSGSSNKKDFEKMLQCLYLYATAPRAEQVDWDVMMSKLSTQISSSKDDPMYIFQQTTSDVIFGGNPRQLQLGEEYLSKVSLDAYKAQYDELFSSLNNMTFFITGSVDLETLKPLVEKYIGSLPLTKKAPKAEYGELAAEPLKGEIVHHFNTPQETPRVIVVVVASGSYEDTQANAMNLEVAGSVLDNLYTRTIREEAGGVYVVQNMMSTGNKPKAQFVNQCIFLTDTSKYEELIPLVQSGIDEVVANGPTEEELQKVTLAMDKNFVNGLRKNRVWRGYLSDWYIFGEDNYTNYAETLKGITTESVREAAAAAFGQGNRIEIVQLP